MSITEKHFQAILAKNRIAEEIRDRLLHSEPISPHWILSNLKDIEAFIGEGNQPSIDDIIKTNP